MLPHSMDSRCSLPRRDRDRGTRRAAVCAQLTIALAVALTPLTGTAAGLPGVAVLDVHIAGTSGDAHRRLEAAVHAGIRAAGGEVVPAQAGADCTRSRSCVEELGRRAGVVLVLRGSVEGRRGNLSVRLEMLDPSSGQVVASKADRCDSCRTDEAYESVSLTASALLTDSLQLVARTAGASENRPPDLPSQPGPQELVPAATSATARPAPLPAAAPFPAPAAPGPQLAAPTISTADHRSGRIQAWTAVGGGAALAGVGVWLIALDGRCSEAPPQGAACSDFWSTRVPGIALAAGGGALAVAGVIALFRLSDRGPGSSVAFLPGPGSLHLTGRF